MSGLTDAQPRRVYRGLIFDVYRRAVETPGDGVVEYETVRCPDAVRVYPVTEDGALLMISERRVELGERVLRVVSGRLEGDESPVAAAARELAEELGLRGGSATPFATSRPMLKVEHTLHHVLVRGFARGAAAPEPLEDVVERRVPVTDLPDLVWSGAVVEDAVALNLLRLHRLLMQERAT